MNSLMRLVGGLLAAAPALSLASASATATLKSMVWTVEDLAPWDGVTSGYELVTPTTFGYVETRGQGGVQAIGTQSPDVVKGVQADLASGDASVSASSSFDQAVARAVLNDPASGAVAYASASGGAPQMTIRPYTRITMRAEVELSVQNDEPCAASSCVPAWARFTISNALGWPYVSFDRQLSSSQTLPSGSQLFSWEGELLNTRPIDSREYLLWGLSAGVGAPLATVPEPASHQLALAGTAALALLAAARRGRRTFRRPD